MKIENTNRGDLFFMRADDQRLIVVTNKLHPLYDPRVEIPISELTGLIDSIRDIGIQEPVIARRSGDNFEVIDGRQRVRCARELSKSLPSIKVPLIVRTLKEYEAEKVNIALNVHRIEESAIDKGMKAQRMLDHGADWSDIEITFGAKRATVEGWIRLYNAPESIKSAVASGEISATEGTKAARKKNPEKAMKQRRIPFEKQSCDSCADNPAGESFPEKCAECAHFYTNHWRQK